MSDSTIKKPVFAYICFSLIHHTGQDVTLQALPKSEFIKKHSGEHKWQRARFLYNSFVSTIKITMFEHQNKNPPFEEGAYQFSFSELFSDI